MRTLSILLLATTLTLIGCPDPIPPVVPVETISKITYVYEKDEGGVPSAILAALSEVESSHASVTVSVFEDDTVDGTGQVPVQFQRAKEASDKYGRPCLVAESVERVVRVRLKPKGREDVLYALEGEKK